MGFNLSNHRRKHPKIKSCLTFYELQKSGTIAPLWFTYKLLIKRGIGRFVRAPQHCKRRQQHRHVSHECDTICSDAFEGAERMGYADDNIDG